MVRGVGWANLGREGLFGVEGPRVFGKQNFNNTCETRIFVGEK